MRKTPTSKLAVFAIGELAAMVRARLATNGQLSGDDLAILRKLDECRYLTNKTDLDRRRRHADEDLGVVPIRLARESRELDAEYVDVLPFIQAA